MNEMVRFLERERERVRHELVMKRKEREDSPKFIHTRKETRTSSISSSTPLSLSRSEESRTKQMRGAHSSCSAFSSQQRLFYSHRRNHHHHHQKHHQHLSQTVVVKRMRGTPNNANDKNDGFRPMEREAHEDVILEENGDLYVFGYGSIVWKFEIEGIEPIETVRCKAFGWQRRFYQGSTDHRGTLEFPGRTVTMTKCSKNSPVSGVAYRIKREDVEKCMENLEFREKQYDLRVQLEIYEDDGDAKKTKKLISSKAVCWIATEDEKNVNWVGEQTVDEIATVIANARGPSGPNYEYLFNLADAMRSFNIEDEHLYELEAQVKKLLVGDNVEV